MAPRTETESPIQLDTIEAAASTNTIAAHDPPCSNRQQTLRIEPKLIALDVDDAPIAASTCAVWLEEAGETPMLFFPRGDVRFDRLVPTNRGRLCPRIGLIRYWSLSIAGLTIDRAAKTCEEPFKALERLQGYVFFDATQLDRIRKVRSWVN